MTLLRPRPRGKNKNRLRSRQGRRRWASAVPPCFLGRGRAEALGRGLRRQGRPASSRPGNGGRTRLPLLPAWVSGRGSGGIFGSAVAARLSPSRARWGPTARAYSSPSTPLGGEGSIVKSGRADLNRRPHGPEPCALSGLSYAPTPVGAAGLEPATNGLKGRCSSIELCARPALIVASAPGFVNGDRGAFLNLWHGPHTHRASWPGDKSGPCDTPVPSAVSGYTQSPLNAAARHTPAAAPPGTGSPRRRDPGRW